MCLRQTRRALMTTVTATAVATLFATRARETRARQATPNAGWSFADDRGTTISLSAMPSRVIAQTTSAAALWDFGVRPVGVFGPFRDPAGKPDLQAGDMDLDQTTWVGDYGELDVEKLVTLGGDLYVDLDRGEGLWYADADTLKLLDPLMPSVGISTANATVPEVIGRFGDLAVALGIALDNPAVAAARADFRVAEAELRTAIAAKPGLKVLAISGQPGQDLYICNPDIMSDLDFYRTLGLDVIIPVAELPTDGSIPFWGITSWEQLGKYPADLLLNDSRTNPALVQDDVLWTSLPAVQAGQTGEWRGTFPYSWQGFAATLRYMTGLIEQATVVTPA